MFANCFIYMNFIIQFYVWDDELMIVEVKYFIIEDKFVFNF